MFDIYIAAYGPYLIRKYKKHTCIFLEPRAPHHCAMYRF